jgi:hypothetical protein
MKIHIDNRCFSRAVLFVFLFLVVNSFLVRISEGRINDDYVGSKVCSTCHQGEYNFWEHTLHSQMVKTKEEEKENSRNIFDLPNFPLSENSISLVVGNIKKRIFLNKVGDNYHFLSKQYNVRENTWEPFRISEWEGVLKEGKTYKKEDYNWNKLCAPCHTTGYDYTNNTYIELSIGCEECHGPGKTHSNSELKDDIINPRSLDPQSANYICAQCHSRGIDKKSGTPFAVDFIPGDDLHSQVEFLKPVIGKNTKFFWGNGMAKKHHEQYLEFTQSKHYDNELACIDCHEPHRLRFLDSPNFSSKLFQRTKRFYLARSTHSMCIKCHTQKESEFLSADEVYRITSEKMNGLSELYDKHNFHPLVIERTKVKRNREGQEETLKYSAKILCNDCHMPMIAPTDLAYNIHTHTFRVPDPSSTLLYGVANACNNCHSDKSPEWSTNKFHKMWATRRPAYIKEEFENLKLVKGYLDEFLKSAPTTIVNNYKVVNRKFNELSEVYSSLLPIIDELDSNEPLSPEKNKQLTETLMKYSDKFCEITQIINTFKINDLPKVNLLVDKHSLEAFNYLCDAVGIPKVEPPVLKDNFDESVQEYKKFNDYITNVGNNILRDKETTFEQWVDVYTQLSEQEQLQKTSIPGNIMKELHKMGLIKISLMNSH